MKKRKIFIFLSLIFIGLLITPTPNQAAAWETIYYDDGDPDLYLSLAVNDSVAVKFTQPAENFKLSGMVVYSNTTNLTKILVSVLNANYDTIVDPFIPLGALGLPPYDVSFDDASPIFTSANASDFYIVLQWNTTDLPLLGVGIDNTTIAGHSYINQSGAWQAYSNGNVMIRARIEDINKPTFDHIPLEYAVEGEDLSISCEVADEFGVESVTLAYRDYNSTTPYATISLSLASGTILDGIWYGLIPGVNVTSAGLEYYIWATDAGFNQRYHGNATVPFVVEVVQMFEIPLIGSIIIIVAISAAAIVLYFYLPKYEGKDVP